MTYEKNGIILQLTLNLTTKFSKCVRQDIFVCCYLTPLILTLEFRLKFPFGQQKNMNSFLALDFKSKQQILFWKKHCKYQDLTAWIGQERVELSGRRRDWARAKPDLEGRPRPWVYCVHHSHFFSTCAAHVRHSLVRVGKFTPHRCGIRCLGKKILAAQVRHSSRKG